MNDERDQTLSLAFMRSHPLQAARVLEALPAEPAGALFARVPARIGTAVLAAMLPQAAARCLATLDDERVMELLSGIGTPSMVALLRHLPPERRRTLVAGLPTAAAFASSLLLGFAEDTLGAWADPDCLALDAHLRCAEALERFRHVPSPHALAFVTDGERRLGGVVELVALLQAPPEATLATLMRPPAALLAAHAPLVGTAEHPGWERASVLPVVEPGQRLVGAMTRDALERALRRFGTGRESQTPVTLPGLLAQSYWRTFSGLLESALTLLPRVDALARERDGR
ncbi:MAG: magnesium transporter [Piscinibacter sp.]|nr:magnesium transporter [Piscinibacter sp.]